MGAELLHRDRQTDRQKERQTDRYDEFNNRFPKCSKRVLKYKVYFTLKISMFLYTYNEAVFNSLKHIDCSSCYLI